jgi:hypothetical protein
MAGSAGRAEQLRLTPATIAHRLGTLRMFFISHYVAALAAYSTGASDRSIAGDVIRVSAG